MNRSGLWFRLGGLTVAGLGFGVTRLFVAEAVRTDTTLAFVFAGLLPLMLGLGVTAYGVSLTVGSFSHEYVSTVSRWCLVGTAAMGSVLALTSLSSMGDNGLLVVSTAPLLAANVLLAGTVGGVVIGIGSARTKKQRSHIQRQANRALTLDRLLRHEVINAVTIIRGNAQLLGDGDDGGSAAAETIERASERIATTIEEVGTLIDDANTHHSIDLAAKLSDEVDDLRSEFPDLDISQNGPTSGVDAAVDQRIGLVVGELLRNAAEQPDTSRITARLSTTAYEARIAVTDDGPGLPEKQRQLLEAGIFPEYDDPSSGFGLQIIRLLVREYDGFITVSTGPEGEGTMVELSLPRSTVDGGIHNAVGVSMSNLYWATVTGIFAGVAMAAFWLSAVDVLPVIGSLYGVRNVGIGFVTHLFHSIIFAFVFAGAVAHPTMAQYVDSPFRSLLAGLAWGTLLWLVAAGFIMPIWLQGLGEMAMLPNLPPLGFVSHAIWGSVLGVAYALVRERPVPFSE